MPGAPATRFCIVDDDDEFVALLVQYMEARGWHATGFRSGEDLLNGQSIGKFDFFIIDLGLPGIDGVDLVPLVRSQSDAGILIVSGRLGPDSFNSALSAGADMFISKPVRFDQIYNAIMAINRRMPAKVKVGTSWILSQEDNALVSPQGREVPLSGLEVSLIVRLHEAGGDPVSREELAAATGSGGGPEFRNLDAAIFRLRRKIEREASCPSPFRTVHGRGYQLADSMTINASAKTVSPQS